MNMAMMILGGLEAAHEEELGERKKVGQLFLVLQINIKIINKLSSPFFTVNSGDQSKLTVD